MLRFKSTVERLGDLVGVRPEYVAHDQHPHFDNLSYAMELVEAHKRFSIQHHHAHIASCMAENGYRGKTLGVAFDGSGYGTDGTVWGGEFLLVDGGNLPQSRASTSVPAAGRRSGGKRGHFGRSLRS